MDNPKAVLVTGCAGFIGSNFVKQFNQEFPSTTIVGIDDLSTGRRSEIASSVKFYEGSILDEQLLERMFTEHAPEFVFHFAAIPRVSYSIEHPVQTTQVNIVGTVSLLEAAKRGGVKRLIYSASSSVYGGAKKLPTVEAENPPSPKSPYAIQKHVGELFNKTYSDLFEIDTVSLRYFNAFGPGQYGDSPYASVVSGWLESLYIPGANPAYLEGDGTQSRDFCYVDNIVQANILAMKCPEALNGEVFNIAYGQQTSINQARELIEKHSGKKLNLEPRPPRRGDVAHSLADISKARRILGYNPKISFEEGLKNTIAWYEQRAAAKTS